MTDSTHLGGRFGITAEDIPDGTAFDHWGGTPVPQHIFLWHDAWASEYVRCLAAGDTSGALTYLRRLRFETPDCDVWRLIERVAAKALDTKRKDS